MVRQYAIALLWDIDGTLLNTARAGIFALEEAARNVLGASFNLRQMPTAGLTDVEIAVAVVRQSGHEPRPKLVKRFLRAYETHLPHALPRRKGRVLPGVRAILEQIEGRAEVLSLLLTGNTRAGARAKLTHYGLDRFFSKGAYADGMPDRPSIARRALEMVRRAQPDLPTERMFVVGDTPHDVRCGKDIGARTIAVATGHYRTPELRRYNPWWAVDQLPSYEEFFGRVLNSSMDRKKNRSLDLQRA